MQFGPTRLAVENSPEWYSPGGSFKDLATYYTSRGSNPHEYLAGLGYSPMARYRDRYAAQEMDGRRYQSMGGGWGLGNAVPLTPADVNALQTLAGSFTTAVQGYQNAQSTLQHSDLTLADNYFWYTWPNVKTTIAASMASNQSVASAWQDAQNVLQQWRSDLIDVITGGHAMNEIAPSGSPYSDQLQADVANATAMVAQLQNSVDAASAAPAPAVLGPAVPTDPGVLAATNQITGSQDAANAANAAAAQKTYMDQMCSSANLLDPTNTYDLSCANWASKCPGYPMPAAANAICAASSMATYLKYAAIGVGILLLLKGKRAVGL